MSFAHLGLSKSLLAAVTAEGYTTPTPIQAQSIPPILEGRDVLGCAQTGTGKTAAFALPILDRLSSNSQPREKGRRRAPRALVLSPTRELASQIEQSLRTYGDRSNLRHAVIYGGVSQHRQVQHLNSGVDIIVATPGRLMDLMNQGYVNLDRIEIFVLDEADQMLDMGFIDPIRRIASQIPEQRQTLLFSATMPPKIRKLADTLLTDPVRIAVTPVASAAPLIDQSLYLVDSEHKPSLLAHLLADAGVVRALVFTRTKHGADKLAKRLHRDGVKAEAIHGNKSQNQRERALKAFRSGHARVLVATDVAARGLDVDGVSHVINFNLPNEPEAYVHRIGRTGRAGATGIAVSFCSRDERSFLRAIERLTGTKIEPTAVPTNLDLSQVPAAHEEPFERPILPRPAARPARRPASRPARRDQASHQTGHSQGGASQGGSARPANPNRRKKNASAGSGSGKPSFGSSGRGSTSNKGSTNPKPKRRGNGPSKAGGNAQSARQRTSRSG